MNKTKQQFTMQKRDWAIIVLLLGIIGTNWFWYQKYQAQNTSNKNFTTNFLAHQIEINKLQACLDANTHPCAITPTYGDLH